VETQEQRAHEASQERHFEWWHHSHPTFAGITGFFAGMLFVTALVVGGVASLVLYFMADA
jgi:hypothetical protein